MSFLDRVNVGTAKLAGLSEDLGMSPGQFNLISTGFFITYVCEYKTDAVDGLFRCLGWDMVVHLGYCGLGS